MLKLMAKIMKKNRIFAYSQIISLNIFINYNWKKVVSSQWKNLADSTLIK